MAVGERGVEGASELEYDKPVPRPDHDSQPFFDGTLRGELMLQRCGACGTWMWPVRVRCISCLSDKLTWAAADGTGTLYSYTSVHQVFHPGFRPMSATATVRSHKWSWNGRACFT